MNGLTWTLSLLYSSASNVGITQVINLAAICTPADYNTRPLDTIYSNFVDALPVVQYCREYSKRLIHFSTCEVYGKTIGSFLPKNSPLKKVRPWATEHWNPHTSKVGWNRWTGFWKTGSRSNLLFCFQHWSLQGSWRFRESWSTCGAAWAAFSACVGWVLVQDPAYYLLKEDETPCIFGPIEKQRWSYACAKQLIERLIYGEELCTKRWSIFSLSLSFDIGALCPVFCIV